MRPWMRTALAVVLVLAIAAGGFFLPNLVAARLDRAEQDTAFASAPATSKVRPPFCAES